MTHKKTRKSSTAEEWKYIPLDDPSVVWTTYDLGISTALLCAGFELLSVDRENPRKAMFIFNRKAGIERIVNDYWTNRLEIKARSFFDNMKMLKNRIYSE